MEIWLDTINTEVIKHALTMNVLDGITTNPEILSKSSNVKETLQELLSLHYITYVAVQVTTHTAEEMIREATELDAFSNRIIIKIPCTSEGYKAMGYFSERLIPVIATTVLHPKQALIATSIGVNYIAPYYSRVVDDGLDPCQFMKTLVNITKNGKHQTKILAASLRTIDHVVQCAELGVDAVTLKDDLFSQLVGSHPSTEKWICHFSGAWESAQPNTPLWTINQSS